MPRSQPPATSYFILFPQLVLFRFSSIIERCVAKRCAPCDSGILGTALRWWLRKETSHAPSCGLSCGHVRMWIIQMSGTEAMGSSGRRDGGGSFSFRTIQGRGSGGVGVKFDEHQVKPRFRSCACLLSIHLKRHFHLWAIIRVDTFCLSNFFPFVKNFTDAFPYGKETGFQL